MKRGRGQGSTFPFATLESRRELRRKFVPQLFLRSLLRMRRWGIRHFSTFPIMHLFPLPPPKFCLSIVFDSSWEGCNTQEKWKTKVMHFGGEGRGGGQIRGLMGNVEVAYLPISFSLSSNSPLQKSSLKISSAQCPWLVSKRANSMKLLHFVTPTALCPFLESTDDFYGPGKLRVFNQDRRLHNFENETMT